MAANFSRRPVSILFFILITSFLSIPSPARVLFVSPGGVPDGTGASWETAFNTITAGLTASASGDEIWVRSATYSEAIDMKEGVALYGGFIGSETDRDARDWEKNPTVIDASGLNRSVVYSANQSTLDGFTLTGGNTGLGGGLYCYQNSSPMLSNCIITRNTASDYGGGGVYCHDHSSPTLTNCTITGNSALYYGGGVYCNRANKLVLINCIVSGNSSCGVYCGSYTRATLTNCIIACNSGGAVFSYYKSSPTLRNCTLADNKAINNGSGLYCYNSSPVLINCLLWNKGQEIYVDDDSTPTIQYCCIQGGWPGEGNIDGKPLFMDADGGDYHLRESSACIDRGLVSTAPAEDIDGNPRPGEDGLVDMGAYETIAAWHPGSATSTQMNWFVRGDAPEGGDGTSWATALPTISSALRVAGTSDEIWVQTGTYPEAISLEVGVALYGGFAGSETDRDARDWETNPTEIDASGLNQWVVLGANEATLDGFTLTGGEAGGLWCTSSSPTLVNCIITGNLNGGGVCSHTSSPKLTNCTVTNNRESGIRCYRSSITLSSCTIRDNINSGVYCDESSPTITNCLIAENAGGGLNIKNYSTPVIDNCTISGNWNGLFGGGMQLFKSSASVTNCTITSNRIGSWGGGVSLRSDSSTLINCLISDNVAYSDPDPDDNDGPGGIGGGIYCEQGSSILRNCAITGNTTGNSGGGMFISSNSAPVLDSCIIENNSSGEGSSGGGMFCGDSSPTFKNCLIANNTAGQGGALYCGNSSSILTNCTIAGNSATNQTGGMYLSSGSSGILTNCILRNEGHEISGTSAIVTYSCIDSGWPGEGNINEDPMFVKPWDGTSADLHLQPESPCIDAGNPDASYNDGCLPPGLGGVRNDMGAYGGPENCAAGADTPTPTPTETPTMTPTVTPTPTFTSKPFCGWMLLGE